MFEGIDPTMALLLAETQATPEYPITPDAGLQYLQPSELDILTGEPFASGEDIYINGYRYWWSSSGGGGGGGGGNNSNTNDQESTQPPSPATYPFLYDGPCGDAVAAEIADDLHNKTKATGWEYGAVIVRNANGTYGVHNDVFYTSYSPTAVNHPAPRDGSIVGTVHTHPEIKNAEYLFQNYENRYPSEADWAQADKIVAEGGGDSNKLSVYLVDYLGVVREFRYVDKAMYLALQPHEKQHGKGLPAPTNGCSA
jgi:hypothetical protein